jgi:hypothetical protein
MGNVVARVLATFAAGTLPMNPTGRRNRGVIILQQLAAMLLSDGPIERRMNFLF